LCVHFIYFGSCAFAYCAVPKESQFPMRWECKIVVK
jgi:hypothetical protein